MRTRRSLIPPPLSKHEVVVMGASAGGFKAFSAIVTALPPGFPLPLLLVQHLHQDDNGAFALHLAAESKLPVIEPCDKDQIKCGNVYIAPAGYHLLVERGGTIALSTEEKVNWSRPSIDVLFESAARLWGERVIGVIMTGASSDGTAGIQAIKAAGGLTIAQMPDTAEYPFMPQAAIDSGAVDEVLTIEEIIGRVTALKPADNDYGSSNNTEQRRNQYLTRETSFIIKLSLNKAFSRRFFFVFTPLLSCSVFQMLFFRLKTHPEH